MTEANQATSSASTKTDKRVASGSTLADNRPDTTTTFLNRPHAYRPNGSYYIPNDYDDDVSSMNATIGGLPGPGRGLDQMYQSLGRKLERFIEKRVRREDNNHVNHHNDDREDDTPAICDHQRSTSQGHCDCVEEVISRNQTISGLPGPGRSLDMLYQFLGRKLERTLGKLADSAGFGPEAAERTIMSNSQAVVRFPSDEYTGLWGGPPVAHGAQRYRTIMFSDKGRKDIIKRCKRLLNYASSASSPATQLQAYRKIIALGVVSPGLAEILHDQGATTKIHKFLNELHRTRSVFDPDYYPLLAASRQALIVLSDSEMNALGKHTVALIPYGGRFALLGVGYYCEHEKKAFEAFIQKLSDPEYAFLALRYIDARLNAYRSRDGMPVAQFININIFRDMVHLFSRLMKNRWWLEAIELEVLTQIIAFLGVLGQYWTSSYSKYARLLDLLEAVVSKSIELDRDSKYLAGIVHDCKQPDYADWSWNIDRNLWVVRNHAELYEDMHPSVKNMWDLYTFETEDDLDAYVERGGLDEEEFEL